MKQRSVSRSEANLTDRYWLHAISEVLQPLRHKSKIFASVC
jgi:hypothetical protein